MGAHARRRQHRSRHHRPCAGRARRPGVRRSARVRQVPQGRRHLRGGRVREGRFRRVRAAWAARWSKATPRSAANPNSSTPNRTAPAGSCGSSPLARPRACSPPPNTRRISPPRVDPCRSIRTRPKTSSDMLAAIGAKSIDDLFDEIPKELRIESLAGIPDALNEMQIGRLMSARAAQDGTPLNFIGAGAYEHHIPVGGVGRDHARRVLQRVHALPGRGLAGHAAAHLRIPDHDYLADGHGCVECLAVRRRLGGRGSLAHGHPRAPQVEVAAHPRADHGESELPQGRGGHRRRSGRALRRSARARRASSPWRTSRSTRARTSPRW